MPVQRLIKTETALRGGIPYKPQRERGVLAWLWSISTVLIMAILAAALLLVGFLFTPFRMVWRRWRERVYRRRKGVISEDGIHFPTAYGQVTVAWSGIRTVVRQMDCETTTYRITSDRQPGAVRDYVMSRTDDDSGFERELENRNIPFQVVDRRLRKG